MLSEISQTQIGFHSYEVPRTVKSTETESRMAVARGWGWGGGGVKTGKLLFNRYEFLFGKIKNMF